MISIIPQPVRCIILPGRFQFDPSVCIQAENGAAKIASVLADQLAGSAGYPLPILPTTEEQTGKRVIFRIDEGLHELGSEGYRLEVAEQRLTLAATAEAGLFHALQTLLQLLPAEIFSPSPVTGLDWALPCLEIEDWPRFTWRGAMLDTGRHFMPKKVLFKFIDLLALHKLNTFHWHLTEDQGWRVEIKRYPRLVEVGAWRKETVVGYANNLTQHPVFDGKPHGGYYTQAEVREVVEYARQRFIRVVPEIEMPGHSQAAIAAYPELGNTLERAEVSSVWGVHRHILNVKETTIRFMQDVLEEVLDLFPGEFIHIGGDEAPKGEWIESREAQERMRELGLKNEEELQSYFIRRMGTFLAERGRSLVGWDEILQGGLAEGAVVMSWHGETGGIAAVQAGQRAVMAPEEFTYFDYHQLWVERRAGDWSYLPLSRVYAYDPLPAAIGADQAQRVLGAEGELWTEHIPDGAALEYMAFPRLCALAEVNWTPLRNKDLASFLTRLDLHQKRLDTLGVNYCRRIE